MECLYFQGNRVSNKHIIFTIAFWVLVAQNVFSQQPIPALEREVSLKVNNQTIAQVLAEVSSRTGVKFSYSPKHIDVDKKISFIATNKSIRTILKIVFTETVDFKEKGSFIIITPKHNIASKKPIKEVIISGYVFDDSGEKVAYASILSSQYPMAAVTNQYGYFKMVLPADKVPKQIKVVKEKYHDTIVKLTPQQQQLDVVLIHRKPVEPLVTDTLVVTKIDTTPVVSVSIDTSKLITSSSDLIEKYFLSDEIKANIRNIADTILTSVQFSIVPQLSTNKLLVGNAVNDFSVSMLVGYTKQLNFAGVAGIANIVKGNARYAQAAGLLNVVSDTFIGGQASGMFNLVGKNYTGGQASGLMNIVNGDLLGAQAAGLGNRVSGNVNGAQAASLFNLNKGTLSGVQIAGIGNHTNKYVDGVQVSGIFNSTNENINGAQIAGIFNSSNNGGKGVQISGLTNYVRNDFNGVQIAGLNNFVNNGDINTQVAGLINYTNGNVNGSQISGLINISTAVVSGVQIGPILNVARKVNGVQVGLINISEECNGTPIGLLSFSKNGYNKIELFADDAMHTNLALRTGVQKFHNIFMAGVDLTSKIDGLWSFGYGIGTFYQIHNRWLMGGELQSQLFLLSKETDKGVQVNSLNLQFEYLVAKKFSIALGPTCKMAYNYGNTNIITDHISSYNIYNYTYNSGQNVRIWFGGKVSFKFL